MRFLWPEALWLLLLIPLLVAAYVIALRRRKRGAVRYASLLLVRDSIGKAQRLRRHVPPALLLVALTAAILALARRWRWTFRSACAPPTLSPVA